MNLSKISEICNPNTMINELTYPLYTTYNVDIRSVISFTESIS